jgi:hypothetical protein
MIGIDVKIYKRKGVCMGEFKYKEYTEEENRIYSEAMDKIMRGLEDGLSFHDACNAAPVEDEELKAFILDDALKILIASMHYTKGVPLDEVASLLNVSVEVVGKADREMLDDIAISSTEAYRSNNPDGPTGNA